MTAEQAEALQKINDALTQTMPTVVARQLRPKLQAAKAGLLQQIAITEAQERGQAAAAQEQARAAAAQTATAAAASAAPQPSQSTPPPPANIQTDGDNYQSATEAVPEDITGFKPNLIEIVLIAALVYYMFLNNEK